MSPLFSLYVRLPGAAPLKASEMPGPNTCCRHSSQQPKPRNNCDVYQLANWWTKHSPPIPWTPSRHEKEQTTTLSGMNGPQRHYAKWKESYTSDHTWHDFIYMQCSKKANLQRQKIAGRLSEALGWNRGSLREGRRDLAGAMEVLNADLWGQLCHSAHLLKTPEMQAWGGWIPWYIKYTSIKLFKRTNLPNKLLCLLEAGVERRRAWWRPPGTPARPPPLGCVSHFKYRH